MWLTCPHFGVLGDFVVDLHHFGVICNFLLLFFGVSGSMENSVVIQQHFYYFLLSEDCTQSLVLSDESDS